MKNKNLYLIMTLSLLAQFTNAQIIGGVKASILFNDTELSGTSINTDQLIKPMTGYGVGFIAEYPLNKFVAIKGEMSYIHMGFQLSERTSFNVIGLDIPVGATVTTAFNKLELPILLKYTKPVGNLNLYAEAGPSINYMLNGYIETKANSIIDFKVNKTNLNLSSDNYNRTSLAGHLGVGAEYITHQNFVVTGSLRYNRDFTSSLSLPIVDARVKNKGLSFNIGVAQRF